MLSKHVEKLIIEHLLRAQQCKRMWVFYVVGWRQRRFVTWAKSSTNIHWTSLDVHKSEKSHVIKYEPTLMAQYEFSLLDSCGEGPNLVSWLLPIKCNSSTLKLTIRAQSGKSSLGRGKKGIFFGPFSLFEMVLAHPLLKALALRPPDRAILPSCYCSPYPKPQTTSLWRMYSPEMLKFEGASEICDLF